MNKNSLISGYFDEECSRIKKDFSNKFSTLLLELHQDLESMATDINSIEKLITFESIQTVLKEKK